VKELRSVVESAWYEICGEVSEGHLLAGTHVDEVRKWRSATSYVEKYLAKPEMFPEGVQTGRCWGKWNEELLPVQWKTVEVSLKDAYRIRRIYRRLARMSSSGSLRRLTVFVRHENVVRLLNFLGYRVEEPTSQNTGGTGGRKRFREGYRPSSRACAYFWGQFASGVYRYS
jgi:hypothetical protein